MNLPESSTGLNTSSEAFSVLDALTIVTRSIHNCRVFGYYGGVQKLTALMKGGLVYIYLFFLGGLVALICITAEDLFSLFFLIRNIILLLLHKKGMKRVVD